MSEPQRRTLAALMCARGFRAVEGPSTQPTMITTGEGAGVTRWRLVEGTGPGAIYEMEGK